MPSGYSRGSRSRGSTIEIESGIKPVAVNVKDPEADCLAREFASGTSETLTEPFLKASASGSLDSGRGARLPGARKQF